MPFTFAVREQLKELTKQYDKSENDLKALQSVGQVSTNFEKYNKECWENFQHRVLAHYIL